MASELSKFIEDELQNKGWRVDDEEAPQQALLGALRVEARVKEKQASKKLATWKRGVCVGGGVVVVILVWLLIVNLGTPPEGDGTLTPPTPPGKGTSIPAPIKHDPLVAKNPKAPDPNAKPTPTTGPTPNPAPSTPNNSTVANATTPSSPKVPSNSSSPGSLAQGSTAPVRPLKSTKAPGSPLGSPSPKDSAASLSSPNPESPLKAETSPGPNSQDKPGGAGPQAGG